ncbi:MAG: C69 family dipeptidase [Bacteroidetes bacterium]|nr:C69 family dipeptidase [Bacteroidota bacterium]
MKTKLVTLLIIALMLSGIEGTKACTNFLITKGASTDGSVMISYAADSHVLYGELYHWSAATYPEGAKLDIYEWDTGKYLGQIDQVMETYNVTGNMNEYQVAIGETTYGGLSELSKQPGAIMDYGSLMFISLQRSKNAREAILNMGSLVEKYGYYSVGESFSISDPNEAWIMELIGKGEGYKGAVWVARRVPDGYICAHANQARITTFPLDNGKTSISFDKRDKIFGQDIACVYAADVISFAKEKGFFEGKDKDFSFSDVYAPVDFGGARFCEVRVWAMFNDVYSDMGQYFDYVKGHIEHHDKFADGSKNPNGFASNRMPLWIKPERKISVHDMMNFMRNHLEGTELDMTKDIGAGPFQKPYRWRPLTWKVDDVTYCNERATSTQQTGFSFVAQSRNWLPLRIGGIFWFGIDDAASSVYMPIYSCSTKAPEKIARGYGAMMEFVDDAGFWVFNQISNFVYTRYNLIHPEVEEVQQATEKEFIIVTTAMDEAAASLYKTDPQLAVNFLTDYSVSTANNTVLEWKDFYAYLFTRFMDGNVKEKTAVPEGYIYHNPKLEQPGYSEEFYRQVVGETGEHFKYIGEAGH